MVRAVVRLKESPKAPLTVEPTRAMADTLWVGEAATLMLPTGWKARARSMRPLP